MNRALASVWNRRCAHFPAFPLLILVLLFVSPALASGNPRQLIESFEQGHPGVHVGVLAYDLDANRLIVAHNAKDLFIPASVAKTFVTAALLSMLGQEYRFKTRVFTNGSLEIERGRLHGDLVLKGSGYPGLRDEDLQALADALVHARGIRTVEGGVVVDVSLFEPPDKRFYSDSSVFGDEWSQSSRALAYMGVVSPLSLQYNNVEVRVRGASRAGRPALVEVDPNLPVLNRTKTVPSRDARVSASLTEEGAVRVSGRIGTRRSRVLYSKISSPEKVAGLVFRRAVEKAGARLQKEEVMVCPDRIEGLSEIASVSSDPLPEVLYPMNAYSNNTMAEGFLLVLGALSSKGRANHNSGIQALSRFLVHKVGIGRDEAKLFDAAGLSKNNRVSPVAVIKLLHYMHLDPSRFEAFRASLAAPGKSGTLSKRFFGCPRREEIRAKTGTLSGVSTLAGYLVSEKGHTVAFCIFSNEIAQTYKAKRFEDEIVQALAQRE